MTKDDELENSPNADIRHPPAYRLACAWLETWVLASPPFEAPKVWVTVGLLHELMRAHMPILGDQLSNEAVVAALQDLHIPVRQSPLGVQAHISGATLLACTEAIPMVRAAARQALLSGGLLIVCVTPTTDRPLQTPHSAPRSLHLKSKR